MCVRLSEGFQLSEQTEADTDFHQYQHLSCLKWLLHFDIASHVPVDDSISYEALAEVAKVPQHHLCRIARMAMTSGIFQEPAPNMIAHTVLSSRLVTDQLYLQTLLFLTETSAPTALKIVE